jgi:hypothetical protein
MMSAQKWTAVSEVQRLAEKWRANFFKGARGHSRFHAWLLVTHWSVMRTDVSKPCVKLVIASAQHLDLNGSCGL